MDLISPPLGSSPPSRVLAIRAPWDVLVAHSSRAQRLLSFSAVESYPTSPLFLFSSLLRKEVRGSYRCLPFSDLWKVSMFEVLVKPGPFSPARARKIICPL